MILVRSLVSTDGDRRRARRERARQQLVRRRRRGAGLSLLALAAVAALLISGVSAESPRARVSSLVKPRASVAEQTSRARPGAHPDRPAPAPGSLAQTNAYPSATSSQFKSIMASLWTGIVHGSLEPALPAFFPKDAYVRLKAIASASSDWADRLVNDYGLDIIAAHALLGGGAARARLITVNVPSGYGHWIEPGVCYNSVGYYELPNARIVYREDGETRSFGIASMISWRGVWYVVHLGAILRSTGSGTVDEPATGVGSSAYSGTC